MTPAEVNALSSLVASLAWLAVLGGFIGGVAFVAGSKVVLWAMDSLVPRRYRQYRVAAMLARQQQRVEACKRKTLGVNRG